MDLRARLILSDILPLRSKMMPMETGARVTLKKGQLNVIDGPFVEAKEVVGGYAIFEFKNKEEAVALAVEFMQLHRDHMPGWEGTCEVRAFAGFAGQPPE